MPHRDVRLKKSEKNELFLLVRQSGLNPADFLWAEEESSEYDQDGALYFTASVLKHRPTGYFCKFGGVWVEISPGPQRRVEASEHSDSWELKLNIAGAWLEELAKDVEDPDLWATIGQEKVLPTAASSASVDNRPFTLDEQTTISAKLEEIKTYIIEDGQFATAQATAVEREFAYLKDASTRLGRKDWLNVLLGGLVGLAVTLALEPEKAKGLLRLAGTVFQSLWGVVQAYLP